MAAGKITGSLGDWGAAIFADVNQAVFKARAEATARSIPRSSWRHLTALTAEPAPITLIEINATVIGYEGAPPLTMMGAWLDRAVRLLEDAGLGLLQWLWRWVQQVKRYCLNLLSQL
jgi:hypothetical protein